MSTILERERTFSERLLTDASFRSSSSTLQRRQSRFSLVSMEASPSLELRVGADTITLERAPGNWFIPILKKISELGALPSNWNSYGSKPISTEAAEFAIWILQNLLQPTDPMPSLVPTSRGGILIEWHENGIDLEVDVRSMSHVHLVFERGDIPEEIDRASVELIGEKLQMLRLPNK